MVDPDTRSLRSLLRDDSSDERQLLGMTKDFQSGSAE
jgi:hypothetical protein